MLLQSENTIILSGTDSTAYTKDKENIIFKGDNISLLTNDSGYITQKDIPAHTEESDPVYNKDKPNIAFKGENISEFVNDSKYIHFN